MVGGFQIVWLLPNIMGISSTQFASHSWTSKLDFVYIIYQYTTVVVFSVSCGLNKRVLNLSENFS